MLPVQNGSLIASLIPGARLEILDGVGHLFFWERPEQSARTDRRARARPGPEARVQAGEFSLSSAGVTLSGEGAGEGPDVVLLHGLTATRRYVVMGSRALERSGRRVIAYDARGHGRSAPAPGRALRLRATSPPTSLAVLDGRASSVRSSRAPRWARTPPCAFALAHPERVAALALITPAYDPAARARGGDLAHWDALARGAARGRSGGLRARL